MSVRLASAALFAVCTTTATACPYCQTDIGREVRQSVFNSQFAATAGLTALPLLLLAGVVAEIRYGVLFPDKPAVESATSDKTQSETE